MTVSVLRPTPEEAFEAYRAQVLAHRGQVERLTEQVQQGEQFWSARVESFRPGVLPIEEWDHVRALARPDDVWLDIGAGAGRFVAPLSPLVRRVVAIEPSSTMRQALAEATASLDNVEVVDLRWPAAGRPVRGDVALAANVLYDVLDLGPFLEAMEESAERCVVVVSDRAPRTPDAAIWERLFDEPLCSLPALHELLAVLGALGRRFDVATALSEPTAPVSLDAAHRQLRWRYGLAEDSPRDALLRDLIVERFGLEDGSVLLPPRRLFTAVVSWESTRR